MPVSEEPVPSLEERVPSPAGPLRAVIFDVDGTLAETERDGHRIAFNDAFAAAGLPYRWSVAEYGDLLHVTGGARRIAHFLRGRGWSEADAAAKATELHADKTRRFIDIVRTAALPARPGVTGLLDAIRAAGLRTAVATTGTRAWVSELVDTLFGPGAFEVVLTGTEVPELKPDPAVYLRTLDEMDLPASAAVAVEDSRNGVRAATAAGLACAAVPNGYTRDHDFTGATVCTGFGPEGGVRALTVELLRVICASRATGLTVSPPPTPPTGG